MPSSFVPRLAFLAASFWVVSSGGVFADDPHLDAKKVGKHRQLRLNPFRPKGPEPTAPMTLVEIGNRIDVVEEGIRDDGLVVIKQPDVYSQARMTKYRSDFEKEMQKELDKFKFILSARVARTDQAAFESQTALGASLAATGGGRGRSGTTVVNPTPSPAKAKADSTGAAADGSGGDSASGSDNPASKTALDLLKYVQEKYKDDPIAVSKSFELLKGLTGDLKQETGNLGLEPTIYVDQKRRYLDNLNQVRRINIGDDIADSAGYGLYLVRMPASITPGAKTAQGYGAQLSVTAEHEFTPDFLRSTFRTLVINDLVDQLTPLVYEEIRNGRADDLIPLAQAQAQLKDPARIRKQKFLLEQIKSDEVIALLRENSSQVYALLNDEMRKNEIDSQGLAQILRNPGGLKDKDLEKILKFINSNKQKSSMFVPEDQVKLKERLTGDPDYGAQVFRLLREDYDVKRREAFRESIPYDPAPPPPPSSSFYEGRFIPNSPSGVGSTSSGSKEEKARRLINNFTYFILRENLSREVADIDARLNLLSSLLDIALDSSERKGVAERTVRYANIEDALVNLNRTISSIRSRADRKPQTVSEIDDIRIALETVIVVFDRSGPQSGSLPDPLPRAELETRSAPNTLANLLEALYRLAREDDVRFLDRAIGILAHQSDFTTAYSQPLAKEFQREREIKQSFKPKKLTNKNLSLPSDRNARQYYPVAPDDIPNVFLQSTIDILAVSTRRTLLPQRPRVSDVRAYLRNLLAVAYDAMSRPPSRTQDPTGSVALRPTGLCNVDLMHQILDAVRRRAFAERPVNFDEAASNGDLPKLFEDPPSDLTESRDRLWADLLISQDNLVDKPLGVLCWAIAVDAGLLDLAFKEDIRRTLEADAVPVPDDASYLLYCPACSPVEPDPNLVFQDYIRRRWKIITFALDPTSDEQNILDAFSLRRDLQLAVAFAFASGRISFSQLNTFRRRLEQDAETIALNRTVTSFGHGNDVFGWRISPRYQNPPNQKTNVEVLSSLLIAGGPGPNYQIKKSRIEPGWRELTAVIIMPSFLPRARFHVTGNWYKLTNPDDLAVTTGRMLEEGRYVTELRETLAFACNAQHYRPTDVRQLNAKIDELEAMLPRQSRVVRLPFEDVSTGFDLFVDGAEGLVPRLLGYQGCDAVRKGQETNILVQGKNFSIHETKVVAGGQRLSEDDVEIISRQYIRLRLPKNVYPTTLYDNKSYVEIHLATPTGISDRLLIPYLDEEPTPGYSIDPRDTRLTVYYQWHLLGPHGPYTIFATKLPEPAKIRIRVPYPTDAAGAKPSEATLVFDLGMGRSASVTLDAAPSGNAYEIDTKLLAAKLLTALDEAHDPGVPTALPPSLAADVVIVHKPSTEEPNPAPSKVAGTLTVGLVCRVTGQDALKDLRPKHPAANTPAATQPSATPPPQPPSTGAPTATDPSKK